MIRRFWESREYIVHWWVYGAVFTTVFFAILHYEVGRFVRAVEGLIHLLTLRRQR